ncbi:hypothetical protein GCM10009865_38490 [Aeromicrobium ponti]|uniref:Carboxypeptidase family protein n=1 Tax=Cytobacillus oceanisediminis TaxID=665099 RepID=A0A562JJ64_9BACI|nr:hypothetical protein [Cytobacillus oceanisediminis]TWH83148.1 hypothetical protein IQ19_03883 [Cytobacillus oceanisediminis]
MTETISISGQVQGFNRVPISNIKVSAYTDWEHLGHVFTDEDGKYKLSIPSNSAISVCFDTHPSLTNAKEWHPSVVANIDARQDIVLNRFLMRVGTSDGAMADLDVLAAYQFCAMWINRDTNLDKTYAEYTVFRISQMKQPLRELEEFRGKLQEYFLIKSHSS